MALASGRDVVGRLHLRVGAREVEVHLAGAGGQPAPDPDRDIGVEVVVQEVPELVRAVGDLLLDGERLLGRVFREIALRLEEGVGAVQGHELADAALADPKGGQHRLDIPQVLLRHPAVRAVQGQEVPVHLPRLHELQGRDLEAFLVQLGEAGRDARRHRAADVGGVDEVPAVGDDSPVHEDRLDEVEIGHVGGQPLAVVGVVRDHHVTRFQIIDPGKRRAHVAIEEAGHPEVGRVGEEPPRGGRDGRAEVARLLHVGRAGGPLQGDCHLFGDGRELVEEDLHLDGIELHAGPASVRRRVPSRSARACQPGSRNVVVSACSMMAGPCTTVPAPTRSLE